MPLEVLETALQLAELSALPRECTLAQYDPHPLHKHATHDDRAETTLSFNTYTRYQMNVR